MLEVWLLWNWSRWQWSHWWYAGRVELHPMWLNWLSSRSWNAVYIFSKYRFSSTYDPLRTGVNRSQRWETVLFNSFVFRINLIQNCPSICKPFSSFCSDPSWGGRNYILKWVFFVQSILADRYIHRREFRLVSLESLSSVEYGIKNNIFIFDFDREISRFKLSRK